MANVDGTFYTGRNGRPGASPESPGSSVDNPVNPVNPAGDNFEGITLNGNTIGGVKRLIETNETLNIPEYWQYIVTNIDVDGIVNNDGEIVVL